MIALCFLTYGNLSQTELWNRELQKTALYNIYIHNKKPFCDHVTHFHDYCIDDIVPTKWGHISLIHATLNLFKEAYENEENEFFILLSDKCIPLHSLDVIHDKIKSINNNIIEGYLSEPYRYDHLENKAFFSKEKFYKQSQFFVLKRHTMRFFVENNFTEVFGEKFSVPDEHYFINIFEKFRISYENKAAVYVNWKEGCDGHPKQYDVLDDDEVNSIKKDYLFIRKISNKCVLPKYFENFNP